LDITECLFYYGGISMKTRDQMEKTNLKKNAA